MPRDSYSTSYASGLARGFKIPIVHVNADDPEALRRGRAAGDRVSQRFHRDFLIDLIGYRRHGHNEGDEPAFTQPMMYQKIAAHPSVREIWAQTLVERGVVAADVPEALNRKYLGPAAAGPGVTAARAGLRRAAAAAAAGRRGGAERTRPSRSSGCAELNASLLALPAGFSVHRKLERARDKRGADVRESPDERTVDWAAAEELAFASILADGTSIRLTGEDVERGTFSHRHAVLHDVKTGACTFRCRRCRRRERPSRSTTARSRRTRPSGSSTATTCRSRRVSCSGKRSTATSSTARR